MPREARVDPAFPHYGSDIARQTRYVLENLARTFKAAGTSLDHVVKAQVFHTDLANFAAFDEVWKEFFAAPPPRTTRGHDGAAGSGHAGRDRPDRGDALTGAPRRRVSAP